MMRIIVLLLIIVPALEIGILVLAGNTIGALPTVMLIICTGLLGAWLAKKQGTETITQAQLQLQRGQIPGEAILDGLCILVGGVVLLTPGFITDTLGFLLLLPQTRIPAKHWMKKQLKTMIANGNFTIIRR
jgi:UPF0716 protein FxsA